MNPTYFFEWNKKEAKKLLDGSNQRCLDFYVGIAGKKGQGETASQGLSFSCQK